MTSATSIKPRIVAPGWKWAEAPQLMGPPVFYPVSSDFAATADQEGSFSFLLLKNAQRRIKTRHSAPTPTTDAPKSVVPAQLFEAVANAKVAISRVSMHLKAEWRDKLFGEIDFLMSEENWDHDSVILNHAALETFLRFAIFEEISNLPALGVSGRGTLLSAWKSESEEIQIEFFPKDESRLLLSRPSKAGRESLARRGSIVELRTYMAMVPTITF